MQKLLKHAKALLPLFSPSTSAMTASTAHSRRPSSHTLSSTSTSVTLLALTDAVLRSDDGAQPSWLDGCWRGWRRETCSSENREDRA